MAQPLSNEGNKKYLRIKIISLGQDGAGKSCLIKRYCESKFVSRYISTIGVDFGVRCVKIDDRDCKVNFWDLSGHKDFYHVRNEFYADTQGAIIVYDVANKSSFTALKNWLEEIKKFGKRKPAIIVVAANKTDLKKKRQVSEKDGRRWANQHGFEYFETSAANGQNVNEMFTYVFQTVVRTLPER